MEKGCLLIFFILSFGYTSAQYSRDVVRVKSGSDISRMMSYSDRFQFEKFREGKAHFRNGRVVNARFNYNRVHKEVQFIDQKYDTLILNDKLFVDKITIEADTFYYYERYGHVRLIGNYGNIKLAEQQLIGNMGTERYSAYDQYSSTSAISSYSSFTNGAGTQQALEGSDKVLLKKRSIFFLIDKNRGLLPLNKGSLLRAFPLHKRALNDYFKANKVELEKPEEVTRVLEYADSL